MIYLQLTKNRIKVLAVKRSLLGQTEVVYFEKKYQTQFLKKGELVNPDVSASAIKEVLMLVSQNQLKDKDITLILPQSSFSFLRTEVPNDMSESVLGTYVKEKARAQLMVDLDMCYYEDVLVESGENKFMLFYALEGEKYEKVEQPFQLLGLNIRNIVPEPLAYYKLFEKTLRTEKKENILYASYDENVIDGYVFDSFGLLEEEKWSVSLKTSDEIEDVFRQKAEQLEKGGIKLNRLILSGESSEKIRQDTFTKNVGVWTNPLKRIFPHFYGSYIKSLSPSGDEEVPYLKYDACVGAYIFATENKDFSLFKRKVASIKSRTTTAPSPKPVSSPRVKRGFSFPFVPVIIVLVVASLTAGGVYFFTAGGGGSTVASIIQNVPFNQPTPTPEPTSTPEPTPTPTPSIERDQLNIKIQNGSGVAGKAGEVQDILADLEYGDIISENADSFDYETTVIQAKEASGEAIINLISEDLAEFVDNPETSTDLDDEEAADAIIIVGQDFP